MICVIRELRKMGKIETFPFLLLVISNLKHRSGVVKIRLSQVVNFRLTFPPDEIEKKIARRVEFRGQGRPIRANK
jgi:hypothetical protein